MAHVISEMKKERDYTNINKWKTKPIKTSTNNSILDIQSKNEKKKNNNNKKCTQPYQYEVANETNKNTKI